MKKNKILTIVIVAVLGFILFTVLTKGNKKSLTTEYANDGDDISGYTQITDVTGSSFYINNAFISKATAVTEVSDNVEFADNQYYVYKDGANRYLLFCMDEIVIAVQKGTDFNIKNTQDKESALKKANLSGILFSKGSKELEVKEGDGRTITKVMASVEINTRTYGDYCGELVNIYDMDGTEYSLFAGVPGARWDKLSDTSKEGIEELVNNFSLCFGLEANTDIYAVTVDADDPVMEDVKVEDTVIDDSQGLNLSNQKKIDDKDDTKAYTSSPYALLDIGDNGLMATFNDYLVDYEQTIICVKKIYTGKEAEELIKKYVKEEKPYTYFEAPEGTHFEVAEYDVNFKNCQNINYVDIKPEGFDKYELKYRGIRYQRRSYDMNNYVKEDGNWQRGYMTYYYIPNGCTEYMLECGEDLTKTAMGSFVSLYGSAFYHICNNGLTSNYVKEINEDMHIGNSLIINNRNRDTIFIVMFCMVVFFVLYYFFNNHMQDEKIQNSKEQNDTKHNLKKNIVVRNQYIDQILDLVYMIIPCVVVWVIFSKIIMLSVIQSGSMLPMLKVGNTVFFNQLSYINEEPQRGDVVIFKSKEFNEDLGKRIIGLPGDEIEFKDGYVVINGQYCDESNYLGTEIETNCIKKFSVPEGCYFMLGDNRTESNDSRFWKNPYIPKEDIIGKYMGQIDFSIQFDILHRY